MVLSRVFSLLLGTTLFILIWTMQDGNHAVPQVVVATNLRPVIRESQPEASVREVASIPAGPIQPEYDEFNSIVAPVSTPDATLWMFAAEPPEQIAVK